MYLIYKYLFLKYTLICDFARGFQAFHKDIWLIIIAILILSPILLALMWKVIKGHDVAYHLVEEYLCIWGIYCQKPLTGNFEMETIFFL